MNPFRRHSSSAFTLLELLLATILGAFVAVISLVAVNQLTDYRENVEAYSDLAAESRYILKIMRRDFTNAYRGGWDNQRQCTGRLAANADTIECLITHPQPINAQELSTDLWLARYTLTADTDTPDRFQLQRFTEPLHATRQRPGIVLSRNIQSITLTFWDGDQWLDSWQSTSTVPRMIAVDLTLHTPADAPAQTLRTSELISLMPVTDNTLATQTKSQTADSVETLPPSTEVPNAP